jgi:protein-S-isoprenylcysteine O-methyltransferase Ste14
MYHWDGTLTAAGTLLIIGPWSLAIQFEKRDLRTVHREYVDYSRRVPMLIPTLTRQRSSEAHGTVSHAGRRG